MTSYGISMIVVAVGLVLLSFSTGGVSSPSQWLVDWTNWAFTFFAISIGGRGVWLASDEMIRRIRAK